MNKALPISVRDRAGYASLCVTYLETALDYAKKAGAPRTTARLRLALSSARGAVRNAGYRVTRERMQEER